MFQGVGAVVIVVDDLEAGVERYETIFGQNVDSRGGPADGSYRNAIFRFPGSVVELISPSGNEGPVARRLQTSGPGVYMMMMRVDDVAATVDELRAKGVRLLGDPGVGNEVTGQVFVHPAATGGVLIELASRV